MKEKDHDKNQSRRRFIQQSTLVGTGLMMAGPLDLFAIVRVSNPVYAHPLPA